MVSEEIFRNDCSLIEGFRFAIYKFDLVAKTEIVLPPYKGSTLRGGFVHAFKNE